MKLSVSFFFVVLVLSLSVVSAEIVVRSFLNQKLTPRDTKAVDRAGYKWLKQQEVGDDGRHLRRAANPWCPYLCSGFPCGQCFIWMRSCWDWCGQRRRDEELAPSEELETLTHVRELSTQSEECREKIEDVLLVMEDAVSEDGEPIVESSGFTCYEYNAVDEEDAEPTCEGVASWNVWDATQDILTIAGFEEFPTICQSEMRKSNIEAAIDDADCDVVEVDFSIVGPHSYSFEKTEKKALYFLYGNRNDEIHRTYYPFPTGDYEVMVDIQLKSGEIIEHSLDFVVEDC